MSYRRRRVPVACTLCRKRKRRCDAQRPKCSTCQELDATCVYDELPIQRVHGDLESDAQDSLQRIEELLQANAIQMSAILDGMQSRSQCSDSQRSVPSASTQNETSPFSPGGFSSPNTDIMGMPQTPSTFTSPAIEAPGAPFMIPEKHRTSSNQLLMNPLISSMIGTYPADLFFQLESNNNWPPELSLEHFAPVFDTTLPSKDGADMLVTAFFSHIHPYHPILDYEQFMLMYRKTIELGYPSGIETTLCLVVFALGSIAFELNREHYKDGIPGLAYMQNALPHLLLFAGWTFKMDVLVPQALVLGAVYFAYLAKPLHSWKQVSMAAPIVQFMISRLDDKHLDSRMKENINRVFWSCFMIECDRIAELELPRSSLQQHTDNMLLPSFENRIDTAETTYYLAEISVRRLLNRVHNSIYPRRRNNPVSPKYPDLLSVDQLTKLHTIATELYRQLETWLLSIPDPYRPKVFGNWYPLHDRERVLGIRFFATRHIIFRPFILHTVSVEAQYANKNDEAVAVLLPPWLLENCRLCVESCRNYLYNAGQMLTKPSPYTWTFSISSLGAIMVLTLASRSSHLQDLVPDIDILQNNVINGIEPWAKALQASDAGHDDWQSQSSLVAAVQILKDLRRKRRLLVPVG